MCPREASRASSGHGCLIRDPVTIAITATRRCHRPSHCLLPPNLLGRAALNMAGFEVKKDGGSQD
uniref:Uncharacterized protein n=1 Tax=Oryza sativa subsp. japonica TaxID=39947 RepID=Q6H670_ORYSJ|nr:hypothetical protein [Oryza sativa Japonica Group]BAD25779.1 hypothetical protein [Oryza sativa Japonica Group]